MKTKFKKILCIILSTCLMASATVISPISSLAADTLDFDAATPYVTHSGETYLFSGVDDAKFEAYKQSLENEGYTVYAKTIHTVAGVEYYTYKLDNNVISISKQDKTYRITKQVLSENEVLPLTAPVEYEKVTEPVLTQLECVKNSHGMAYAIKLPNGHYFMIDGGGILNNSSATEEQAINIYNFLKNDVGEGNKIHIDGWFISHLHSDHILSFQSFVNKYKSEFESGNIVIDELLYNFPTAEECDTAIGGTSYGLKEDAQKSVEEFLFGLGTKVSTTNTGYRYYFAGMDFEVISSVADYYKGTKGVVADTKDVNATSTVIKMNIAGQSILFFADSASTQLWPLIHKFGNYLKSDIVQVIHHGITYGQGEYYDLVGAETVLYPSDSSRVESELSAEQNQSLYKLSSTKEVVFSYLGNRSFNLPYTPPENLATKFTAPDGDCVYQTPNGLDLTSYQEPYIGVGGDIFDEDTAVWSRYTSNPGLRLRDGGNIPTWGSIGFNTAAANVNGSEKSVYVNTSWQGFYSDLPQLKPNKTYKLTFDYKSISEPRTEGYFSEIKVTGFKNTTAPADKKLSGNIVSTSSKGMGNTEVAGEWNKGEVSFTVPAEGFDEYTLSFYYASASNKGVYLDNIKLVEKAREYYSIEQDYENTDIANHTPTNMEATVIDDGSGKNKVLNLTATKADYCGVDLLGTSNSGLVSGKTYHITGNFKITSGAFKVFRAGPMNDSNIWNINIADNGSTRCGVCISPNGVDVSTGVGSYNFDVSLTLTNGSQNFGIILLATEIGAAIQFDNIKISEVIETVEAKATPEEGGTVTVKNKNTKFGSTYAKGETAVFTAVANENYKFAGWVDNLGNTVVGGTEVEYNLNGDTVLTAKFEAPERKSDILVDFENVKKIYASEAFEVTQEEGSPVNNKVLYYKGTDNIYGSDQSKNRVAFNLTDVNTKKITEVVNPGEYLTVRFKYKYADASTAPGHIVFYTMEGSNIWEQSGSNFTYKVNKLENKGTDWQTMSVSIKAATTAVNYNYLIGFLEMTGDIYFDDIMIYRSIDTAFNGVGALRAASTSATGKNGLRIYNNIDESCHNFAYAEYGSVAIRKAKLSAGEELTVNTTDAVNGVSVTREGWNNVTYKKIISENSQGYTFSSYLVNIPEEYYAEPYVVRAYKRSGSNSQMADDYEYGRAVEVCVFDIANQIDIAENPSNIDKTAFFEFVNERTKAAYEQWVKDNQRTTGNLFAEIK